MEMMNIYKLLFASTEGSVWKEHPIRQAADGDGHQQAQVALQEGRG